MFAIRWWNPQATVQDIYRCRCADTDRHGCPRRSVREGVVHQIAQGFDGKMRVAGNKNLLLSPLQFQRLSRLHRHRSKADDNLSGQCRKVNSFCRIDGHDRQAGTCQQLPDKAVHVIEVAGQLITAMKGGQAFQSCPQDGERRFQLMRGVDGKALLVIKAVRDPIHRIVECQSQRNNLGRGDMDGKTRAKVFWPDSLRFIGK